MNIFNDVVSGASKQFGREFGRAGANAILNGANSYTITGDYSGRIKPSDSTIVKNIKTIQKLTFVTTNKGNISRLITIIDLMIDSVVFDGDNTLRQTNDIKELINQYNDKFEHGSALVDDDYKDKSVDYLKEKRQEFVDLMVKFNEEVKTFVEKNLQIATEKRKSKKVTTLLSFPFGSLGLHQFYLGNTTKGVLYLLFSWTGIPVLLSLFDTISYLVLSTTKFDIKYNNDYVFYKLFKIVE